MDSEDSTATARRHPTRFVLLSLGLLLLVGIPAAGWLWWKSRGVEAYRYIRIMCPRNAQGEMIHEELQITKDTHAAIIRSPMVISAALRTPGVTNIVKGWRTHDEIGALRDRLAVTLEDRSEILEVILRGQDPEDTIKVLNAITDAYEREFVLKEKQSLAHELGMLEQRHSDAQQQLEQTLAKIRELEKAHENESSSKAVEIELSSLVRQQERIEERLLETEMQIAVTQKLDSPPQSLDALHAQQAFLQQKLEQIERCLQEQIGRMDAAMGTSVELESARIDLGWQKRLLEDIQLRIDKLNEGLQARPQIQVIGSSAVVRED